LALLPYPHRGAVREAHVQGRRDLPNLCVDANANAALPGFLGTARHIAAQTIRPKLVPDHLPLAEP
jgi:hypothetical protein